MFNLYKKVIADVTQCYSATASAEHGIGLLKKDLLHSTRSQEEIDIYKAIKNIFDPKGVLNPNKLCWSHYFQEVECGLK